MQQKGPQKIGPEWPARNQMMALTCLAAPILPLFLMQIKTNMCFAGHGRSPNPLIHHPSTYQSRYKKAMKC